MSVRNQDKANLNATGTAVAEGYNDQTNWSMKYVSYARRECFYFFCLVPA